MHVFKGYQVGAVDYLFKPIDPYLLQAKVQIFLDIYYHKTQRLVALLHELQQVRLELEKNNKELEALASKDGLTQLPNRREFDEELKRCLNYAVRYESKFALLFIDIDNFKIVNDDYGHLVGDALLKIVSSKVLANLRQADFLARYGGDEFALILTRLEKYEDAGKVADAIKEIFQKPQIIEGQEVNVTTSIGIACYPLAGETEKQLVKNADIAMYRAKSKGKNTHQYFNEKINEEYSRRAIVEKALHTALENDEFYLVYQPIYNLLNKTVVGVEALLRWNHEKLGEVSPDDFIQLAEESGLMQEIGLWVVKHASQQFYEWYRQGLSDLDFSINMSVKQLQQESLIEKIDSLFAEMDSSFPGITFELDEAAIMQSASGVERALSQLNQMGVRISVDDFGTGYSSLTRLRHLPIHALKIDRSFVNNVLLDLNDAAIAKAILSLANSFGFKAIAEGIETKEQLDFLIKNHCHYGQGFYFGKPRVAKEVGEVLIKGAGYAE
jgi:diguanylate cyclase (GGDEF)-like protein